MQFVEPRVYLIGETTLDHAAVEEYLDSLGTSYRLPRNDDGHIVTDAEQLAELAGRLCYRSFEPGLNPNVTKVREGNAAYIANIIKQMHGSVFEHDTVNLIFQNVSRVFTHELITHRVGTAKSQESLRYVRLDALSMWAPTVMLERPDILARGAALVEQMEALQLEMAQAFGLDDPGVNFEYKKKVTSAMRRFAPDGLATTILWSANLRSIRHLIELRTAPGAEEEIRLVFGKVGALMQEKYPHIFGDYTITMVDGHPWYQTEHRKI